MGKESDLWWHQFKGDKGFTGPTRFPEKISEKEYKAYIKDGYGFKKMPVGTKVFSEDPTK